MKRGIEIADAKQTDVARLVLARYFTCDSIGVVIPGVKQAEQVLDNLKTVDIRLTAEEIQEIERTFQ